MKARSPKDDWKWRRGRVSYPKCGGNWAGSELWKLLWITEASRSLDRRTEGFRNHLAIDGSLNGVSRKDAARGWAVVQLNYDKKEESWYASYGTMLADCRFWSALLLQPSLFPCWSCAAQVLLPMKWNETSEVQGLLGGSG